MNAVQHGSVTKMILPELDLTIRDSNKGSKGIHNNGSRDHQKKHDRDNPLKTCREVGDENGADEEKEEDGEEEDWDIRENTCG